MAEPTRRTRQGVDLDYAADRTEDQHQGVLDREKIDPSLKGKGMTSEQVEASGGLGAYARAHAAKGPTAEAAGAALATRKKKPQ